MEIYVQKDLFSRDEPPSITEAYFCLGLEYLESYDNPIIIKELPVNQRIN